MVWFDDWSFPACSTILLRQNPLWVTHNNRDVYYSFRPCNKYVQWPWRYSDPEDPLCHYIRVGNKYTITLGYMYTYKCITGVLHWGKLFHITSRRLCSFRGWLSWPPPIRNYASVPARPSPEIMTGQAHELYWIVNGSSSPGKSRNVR